MFTEMVKRFVFLLLLLVGVSAFALRLKPNSYYVCYVTKVSDGDTIHCRFPYPVSDKVKSYPVRLIGIDTPETGVRKKNTGKQAVEIEKIIKGSYGINKEITKREVVSLGLEAKRFTEKLLQRVYVVTLETDVRPYDRYGRVLGYIWLPDGKMLNEEIICNGYALP